MAIKSSSKISSNFSMSGMTDIVFLLLIFFMVTSTLIHPNALKLLLPQSTNQTSAKPVTTISITHTNEFYIENQKVNFNDLERLLQQKMASSEDPTISLHVDKRVAMEEVVKVMNIAKDNRYKLILATNPK